MIERFAYFRIHTVAATCLVLTSFFASPVFGVYEDDHIANVRRYQNKVKMKRKSDVAWEDVFLNMDLFAGDRIKTMKSSTAIAAYDNLSHLDIQPNSLVVIKQMTKGRNNRKADVELMKGSLTGKVESKTDNDDIVMEIVSKSGDDMANIRLDTRDTDNKTSSVAVEIKKNDDIFVHVNNGEAKVTARGKSVRLKENESTIVEPGSSPLPPWLGLKRPFLTMIIKICLIFVGIFIVIAGTILIMNKRKMEME